MNRDFISFKFGQCFTSSKDNHDRVYQKVETITRDIKCILICDNSARTDYSGTEVLFPTSKETLKKVYPFV